MSYDKSKPLTKKNLVDFLKSLDIEVKTNTKARGNNGLYQRNRIDVSRGLDEQKSIEVLIHEFAHHIHYQIDKDFNNRLSQNIDTRIKENDEIAIKKSIDRHQRKLEKMKKARQNKDSADIEI